MIISAIIIFLLLIIVILKSKLDEEEEINSIHKEELSEDRNIYEWMKDIISVQKKELEKDKVLWGLEFGKKLTGNIGAVVLFSSRSGARRNKKIGDKVVKIIYKIVK